MKEALTQNDFISRLLNLVNDEGDDANPLFLTATLLLQSLTNLKEDFKKVRIIKEKYDIGIIVIIDDKYVLIIDDKIVPDAKKTYHGIITGRYLKKFDDNNLICIYFNIKDENPNIVEPYKVFTRDKLITILKRYEKDINSRIYHDYLNYITNIEKEKKLDIAKPISEWSYVTIENLFNLSKIDVKNSEDIIDKLGFEWNSIHINKIIFYWQVEYSLEQSTLMVVLKMNYEKSNDIEYILEKKLYAQFFMLMRFGNDFIIPEDDEERFHQNVGYIKFDHTTYESIFEKCLEELNRLERYILD